MGPPTVRPALGALLLLLPLLAAAADNTTTEVWVKMISVLRVSMDYEDAWDNSSSPEFKQFTENVINEVKIPIIAEFGDQHVVTEVDQLNSPLGRTKGVNIFLNTTVKTNFTEQDDVPLANLGERLNMVLKNVKSVVKAPVLERNVKNEDFEFIEPFMIPEATDTTQAETTVREKRSTTALNATTTGAEATTAASTTAENNTTNSPTDSTTSAASTEAEAAATEAKAEAAATEAAATTEAAAAATEAAAATTDAEAAATETTAATTDAAAATTEAANTTMEAASTTTTSTTTETPLPVAARLKCQLSITSLTPEPWMELSFTDQYQQLAGKVEALVSDILMEKYGDNFQSVSVTGFDTDSGSVVPLLEVTVMTDKTSAEDVDAKALAAENNIALQQLVEERDFTFDPDKAETSEEIDIIEPTTTPAPTEDPYKSSILKLTMLAPFANWTDELNETDSQAFADMQADIQAGVELMVSKKYPPGEWNVSSSIIWMENDTETNGVEISFLVVVEPQMTNTSKVIEELAKSFVYFNKMGSLVIAPASVTFKDMTTYAPGRGVVIMDEDYLREMRKGRYNGSFVGDYTTQPPTLRPVVKRHAGFVVGIAVPAFLGMIAAIGLLLICTTIAGAKKNDD